MKSKIILTYSIFDMIKVHSTRLTELVQRMTAFSVGSLSSLKPPSQSESFPLIGTERVPIESEQKEQLGVPLPLLPLLLGWPDGPKIGSTEGSVLGWYDGNDVGTPDGYIRHHLRNYMI